MPIIANQGTKRASQHDPAALVPLEDQAIVDLVLLGGDEVRPIANRRAENDGEA
eukprot:CAMPEP_0115248620 /NCGR_PEP_ID=MMETSP0270-20121206/42163_1 /TAXON_ID=71861 /ORGANISM="Scrippsiella trochoidea, Strain CCMP3099" /LENGTH=53 /DNA_ID=CAMNT_0002663925 /DNA_START=384 /DNA_END=541 /DNA_ORIENTATION=+